MTDRILHIEKLRGIAILLVLLFHLEVPGFSYGYFGVDLFFVISGFLMAHLYGEIRDREQISRFFVKRFARILPAYYALILLVVVASVFSLLPHEIELVMTSSVWSALLLPNFGFWQDAPYFVYMLFRPLLNLWSLGVELQFYLLFPLLLLVRRQSSLLFNLVCLVSLLIYGVTSYVDPKTAFFMLPGRLWEFFAGIYVAQLFSSKGAKPLLGAAAILTLIALILLAPLLELRNAFPVGVLVVLLSAVAVLFGFSTGTETNPVSKSLVETGKYSYSIYLVHFPVIVFFNYVPFEGTILQVSGLPGLLAVLLLIGLLSWLLYNLVETPTRHTLGGRQLLGMGTVAAALMVLVARPAVTIGESRLIPEELNIVSGLDDRGYYKCDEAATARNLLEPSCQLDDLANPMYRFLIVGDSHADTIKQPLQAVLNAANQSLRLWDGYHAIPTAFDGSTVIEEAIRQGAGTIILHQIRQSDDGAGIEAFIQNAAEYDLEVVMIAPVPLYWESIPRTLLTQYRSNGELNRVGMSRAEYDEVNGLLLSRLNRWGEQYDNFRWYNTAQYLCDRDCYIAAEDGRPYYYDHNHLTLTGVELLRPIFEDISAKAGN